MTRLGAAAQHDIPVKFLHAMALDRGTLSVVKFFLLMYIGLPDRDLKRYSRHPATGKGDETHEISCDWRGRGGDECGEPG